VTEGKGSEDRRGQPVGIGTERSWFYTAPVICTRHMEVAAMVMAINTAINATTDALDMAVIQQVIDR
jgi:menin